MQEEGAFFIIPGGGAPMTQMTRTENIVFARERQYLTPPYTMYYYSNENIKFAA